MTDFSLTFMIVRCPPMSEPSHNSAENIPSNSSLASSNHPSHLSSKSLEKSSNLSPSANHALTPNRHTPQLYKHRRRVSNAPLPKQDDSNLAQKYSAKTPLKGRWRIIGKIGAGAFGNCLSFIFSRCYIRCIRPYKL